jgi:hypothetical protein
LSNLKEIRASSLVEDTLARPKAQRVTMPSKVLF